MEAWREDDAQERRSIAVAQKILLEPAEQSTQFSQAVTSLLNSIEDPATGSSLRDSLYYTFPVPPTGDDVEVLKFLLSRVFRGAALGCLSTLEWQGAYALGRVRMLSASSWQQPKRSLT